MKIYECGQSVALQACNLPAKSYKTFACVVDNKSTIEDAFSIMVAELGKEHTDMDINEQELMVRTPKAHYTLAHEKSYDKKGNKVLTPSNILRHVFTRTFTMGSLYINEDKEIVDLAEALRYIQSHTLYTIIPFEQLITWDNDVLMKTIFLKIKYGYILDQTIDRVLQNFPLSVKPLSGNNVWLDKLLMSHGHQFFVFLRNYNRVSKYLFTNSQLKLTATFTPNEAILAEQEAAAKEMFAHPKINHTAKQREINPTPKPRVKNDPGSLGSNPYNIKISSVDPATRDKNQALYDLYMQQVQQAKAKRPSSIVLPTPPTQTTW